MTKFFPGVLQKRYRVIRKLGDGGYGVVALAQDERLDRLVALKRLHSTVTDRRQKVRIRREAHIMASLNHPNILKIHDVFEEDSVLYLVMEYADKGSLQQLLERRANRHGLPIAEVIDMAWAIAGALQAAHHVGIIHRDIKPANILLHQAGGSYIPKLSDFGIAHLSDADTVLTRTGEIIGTPIYLAPEQVSGGPVSPATDVYAFGILLYRLIANKHYLPVTANETDMHNRILHQTPEAVDAIRRQTPAWLSHLVAAMLAKEPAKRPTFRSIIRQLDVHRGNAPKKRLLFQPADFFSTQRRPMMRNLLKSIILLVVAVWLFTFAGGKLPSLSDISVQIPSANQITGFAADIVSRLTPLSENSIAIVKGADQYNGLKLRTTPSQTGIIVDALSDGTSVRVIRYSADEQWAFVKTASGNDKGWVFAAYLFPLP